MQTKVLRKDESTGVRISKKVIAKVKKHTKKSEVRMSVGTFFELAALQKIVRDNSVNT